MIANKNYKCFLQLFAVVDNYNYSELMKLRLVSQRGELERICDDEHIRLTSTSPYALTFDLHSLVVIWQKWSKKGD